MRIYRKEADEVQLIAFPDEHVQKGDYFVIEDPAQSRGLLVQAIDLQYANVPGVLEDILRDVMTDGELSGEDVDPLNISSQVDPWNHRARWKSFARLVLVALTYVVEDPAFRGQQADNERWKDAGQARTQRWRTDKRGRQRT